MGSLILRFHRLLIKCYPSTGGIFGDCDAHSNAKWVSKIGLTQASSCQGR